MKNQDKVKQIVLYLQEQNKDKFSKEEIEKAIMIALYAVDPRTIEKWFTLLWRLGYFGQTLPGIYQMLKIVCE